MLKDLCSGTYIDFQKNTWKSIIRIPVQKGRNAQNLYLEFYYRFSDIFLKIYRQAFFAACNWSLLQFFFFLPTHHCLRLSQAEITFVLPSEQRTL